MNQDGWGMPSGIGARILLTTMMYGMTASALTGHVRRDELEGIDIEREYNLIKQKKSGLSKRLRDMVVYRYERRS